MVINKILIGFALVEWTLIVWFAAASIWFNVGFKDGYAKGVMDEIKRGAKEDK